jgi:predicted enzyme related to lactoylglutathione lyase
MLRGFATVSYYAADLEAASAWYSDVLGIEPYFDRPGYIEFRVGDYEHELGIIDARYRPSSADAPSGEIIHWHVDDLPGTYERLLALGATSHQPPTEHGPGFVTASVVDPFGNVLGVMYNQHYLDVLSRSRA